MFVKSALCCAALIAIAQTVAAADSPADEPQPATRAEVKKALADAKTSGDIPAYRDVVSFADHPGSSMSRAEVRAGIADARSHGDLVAAGEAVEAKGARWMSMRERAEVRAEARKTAHDRTLNPYTIGPSI